MNLRDALDVKVGSTPVNKIYKGTYKVWDRNKIALEGYCKQNTTEGKNYADLNTTFPFTKNGVTVTKNKDGSITLNGTVTENVNLQFSTYIADVTYFNDKQWTLSVKATGKGTLNNIGLKKWYSTNTLVVVNVTNETKSTTATLTGLTNNTEGFSAWVLKDTVFEDFTIYLQLEEGSTATEFEKYTGGQPSPSPDYPQEIEVMQGRQVVPILKNHFNGVYTNGYIGGADGKTYQNKNTTAKIAIIECLPNTEYIIKKGSSDRFRIADYPSYPQNGNLVNILKKDDTLTEVTVTTNTDAQYLLIYVSTSTEQATPKMTVSTTENYTVDLKSKNLYNVKDTYKKDNKCVLDNEDYITVEFDNSAGQSGQYFNYYTKASDDLKPNTDYYLVVEIKQVTGNGLLKAISNDLTYDISQTNSFFAKYFYELSNGQKIVQKITTIADFSNSKSMLRTYIGNSAGQSGSITFRISVLEEQPTVENFNYEPYYDYKLAGIGDYKDNFYTDKGKWYLKKLINKVVLNGSETWYKANDNINVYVTNLSQLDRLNGNNSNFICNYFKYLGDAQTQILGNCMSFNSSETYRNSCYIQCDTSIAQSNIELKNYVKGLYDNQTPILVYSVLKAPTVEEITAPTLINQLNALYQAI